MEIVECSPPYDGAEQTSLISARVVLDALASLVRVGKLGNKAATRRPDAWGPLSERCTARPEPELSRRLLPAAAGRLINVSLPVDVAAGVISSSQHTL
jgi:hypothetical protein